jgi:hypothetical protein
MRSTTLALLAALAACDDSIVVIGVLDERQPPPILDVPTMARAGEAFTVTVSTVNYCAVTEESTLVMTEGADVVVVPYDRWRPLEGDEACLAILLFIEHVATVQFDEAGTRTIRVRGQRVEHPSRGAPADGEVVDLLFSVEVL